MVPHKIVNVIIHPVVVNRVDPTCINKKIFFTKNNTVQVVFNLEHKHDIVVGKTGGLSVPRSV